VGLSCYDLCNRSGLVRQPDSCQPQVCFAEDQHTVQALPADGAYQALAVLAEGRVRRLQQATLAKYEMSGQPKLGRAFVLVLFPRIGDRGSMPHAASVARLCSLLKPDNDARPTFLFGAGASFSSGIPLAAESVKRLAKQAYADFVLGGKTPLDQIKPSEWTTSLQAQPWFIHGEDRLAENFPLVIEHLLKPEAYRGGRC
jgi:hypothetical protein